MTITQLAEIAGCSRKTVDRLVRTMFPNLKTRKGIAIQLNKQQCTAVMEKLPKKNMVSAEPMTNVPSNIGQTSQVANVEQIGVVVAQAVAAAMIPVMQQFTTAVSKIQQPLQIEQPKQDYYSLLAFCSIKNIKVSHSESIMHGKHLKKICSEKNAELRTIPDERWGKVNSYPIDILEEYFTI